MLEAEAKDQGHRRKRSSKKNGLQNFFSGDLQIISVPRIFSWGRPKPGPAPGYRDWGGQK